jgi:hypothetical protein
MSSRLIVRANKQSNSEGSLVARASLNLGLFGDLVDQSLSGVGTLMHKLVVEALSAHEVAKEPSVCGQSSDGNSHVVVNVENFLLEGSKLMRRLLQRNKHLAKLDSESPANKSAIFLVNLPHACCFSVRGRLNLA